MQGLRQHHGPGRTPEACRAELVSGRRRLVMRRATLAASSREPTPSFWLITLRWNFSVFKEMNSCPAISRNVNRLGSIRKHLEFTIGQMLPGSARVGKGAAVPGRRCLPDAVEPLPGYCPGVDLEQFQDVWALRRDSLQKPGAGCPLDGPDREIDSLLMRGGSARQQ